MIGRRQVLRAIGTVGLGLATMARAGLAQSGEQDGIRAVIADQIAAFAADDLGRAFDHASPMIKRMFGTPENFGRMVRDGYPMIWRPGAVRYLDQREEGGHPVQRVEFRDQTGGYHLFDYEMIEGPAGWRINGVFPVRPEDMAV
ncbi:MAG: DUF4864 domain-containing protein [Albidovulum sp.]